MGIVIVEILLQDRLFLFVFGGQDAEYRYDEDGLKKVYEARLAKQIWDCYWVRGERFKAIVLLATFDHYDLQRLLIVEEDAKHLEAHGIQKGRTKQVYSDDEIESPP